MEPKKDLERPQWVFHFLHWFCPPHLLEEIEGDLLQKFERDVKIFGERRAKRKLLWSVIRFCRLGIILRNKFSVELIHMNMIKSYFKVMIRGLVKRKSYSIINILGLTVGITFALLIGVFIFGELRVNQDLKDVDQLYLLESKTKANGDLFPYTPGILPKLAMEQYPSLFQNYYRFWDRNITVSKNEKHFRLQSMIGDSSFIEIFGFSLLQGNCASALQSPNSIVITKKIALQFFNKTDVVGETLTVSTEQNGKREYMITAVIDDPEDKNSVTDFMNMDAQVFLSLENARDFFAGANPDSWQNEIITYVKLTSNEGDHAQGILNKMVTKGALKNYSETKAITVNPISDYHRTANNGIVQKMILLLFIIVVFILILAISNFVNISIAGSFSRSKEVGVRKVIGGLQNQVVAQFLLESICLSVFSGVLSIIFYEVFHSYFGELLEATLPSILYLPFKIWSAIAIGILGIGLLAGIYPALFQSLDKPIDLLKGKLKSVNGTIRFSHSLIALQFFITLFIFIGAVILSKQSTYLFDKDLGYDKSHVLIVSSVPRLWNEEGFQKMESAKNKFMQSPRVQSVSLSWGAPGWNFSPGGSKVYKLGSTADKGVDYIITCADQDFRKVFDLKMVEGNFLNEGGAQQPFGVVINQSAQRALGLQLGDQLNASGYGDTLFTVKGIVQDFNFTSLHEKVSPLMIMHTNDFQAFRYFSFRLIPEKTSESIREVEKLWKATFPDEPLNYSFADEKLKNLYTTELQMQKAATIATILMSVIVTIGVLGLVSLNVSRRNKEISIRKILGASVSNILSLMSKEYVVLMTISFIIAIPLVYFLAGQWLESFAYHIELSWWMFVVPVVVLFTVIILIVCALAMKTALTNPVTFLKYE